MTDKKKREGVFLCLSPERQFTWAHLFTRKSNDAWQNDWPVSQNWQQRIADYSQNKRKNVRSFTLSLISSFLHPWLRIPPHPPFFFIFKVLAILAQKNARVISLRRRSLLERSGSDTIAVVRAVTATMGNVHVMRRQAYTASGNNL